MKFMQWFIAQHGKRPGSAKVKDADLFAAMSEGRRAKQLLTKRQEWDARMESALYAWQVEDKGAPK